ncbi:MAG: gliding motility protein GldN [Bacteroidetes bacterium]|nr:gliding motility protein GldN [Bacteroidota bacterium]
MKMKHILAIVAIVFASQLLTFSVSAQETARDRINRRNNAQQQASNSIPQLSVRAANMNQSLTQDISNVRWMREIYRLVDLNKEKNAPLYYPVEPIGDRMNFFTMIFRLLASGSINAYEFLDGKEIFTDQYRIKFKEGLLDRFKILYHEEGGKYVVDDSDVPSNEVTAYYVKEAWYFDQSNSVVDVKILAICPVLYRQDDFGAVAIPNPLFWLPYENIRPYAARMPIITSSLNNASTGTVDDFFRKHSFQGEIYKTTNMKNLALAQIYPNDTIRKKEQVKIEAQLSQFEKSLWATCAECDSISHLAKKEPVKSASKSAKNDKKRTNEPLSDKKSAAKSSTTKQAKTSTQSAPKRSMRNRR